MTYFKINDNDYSMYVNQLTITKSATYRAQTNAAGNTVVDNLNAKRKIEVGIIPLSSEVMQRLLTDVDNFQVNVSFLNPITGVLEENVLCIIPDTEPEYYTIQSGNVRFKEFRLEFTEL